MIPSGTAAILSRIIDLLSSEAALQLQALYILAISVLALGAGLFYALPQAISKVVINRKRGARKFFATNNLVQVASQVFYMLVFALIAVFLVVLPDGDLRSSLARMLLMVMATVVAVIIIRGPVAQKRFEMELDREDRSRGRAARKRESTAREEGHASGHAEGVASEEALRKDKER